MINYVFKASRTRILGKEPRIMRNEGFMTNGYIAIKEELEPKYIKELKNTVDDPPSVLKILSSFDEQYVEFEVTPIVEAVGEDAYVLLRNEKLDKDLWANVYYVSLFLDLDGKVSFWSKAERGPVFVKMNGEIIGIVMPTTHASRYIIREAIDE